MREETGGTAAAEPTATTTPTTIRYKLDHLYRLRDASASKRLPEAFLNLLHQQLSSSASNPNPPNSSRWVSGAGGGPGAANRRNEGASSNPSKAGGPRNRSTTHEEPTAGGAPARQQQPPVQPQPQQQQQQAPQQPPPQQPPPQPQPQPQQQQQQQQAQQQQPPLPQPQPAPQSPQLTASPASPLVVAPTYEPNVKGPLRSSPSNVNANSIPGDPNSRPLPNMDRVASPELPPDVLPSGPSPLDFRMNIASGNNDYTAEGNLILEGPPPGWGHGGDARNNRTARRSLGRGVNEDYRSRMVMAGGGMDSQVGGWMQQGPPMMGGNQGHPMHGGYGDPLMGMDGGNPYGAAGDEDPWDYPVVQEGDECMDIFTLGDIKMVERNIESSGLPPEVYLSTQTRRLLMERQAASAASVGGGAGAMGGHGGPQTDVFFQDGNKSGGESRFISIFDATRREAAAAQQQRLRRAAAYHEQQNMDPSLARDKLLRLLRQQAHGNAGARPTAGGEDMMKPPQPAPSPSTGRLAFAMNPAAPNFNPSGMFGLTSTMGGETVVKRTPAPMMAPQMMQQYQQQQQQQQQAMMRPMDASSRARQQQWRHPQQAMYQPMATPHHMNMSADPPPATPQQQQQLEQVLQRLLETKQQQQSPLSGLINQLSKTPLPAAAQQQRTGPPQQRPQLTAAHLQHLITPEKRNFILMELEKVRNQQAQQQQAAALSQAAAGSQVQAAQAFPPDGLVAGGNSKSELLQRLQNPGNPAFSRHMLMQILQKMQSAGVDISGNEGAAGSKVMDVADVEATSMRPDQ